MIVCVILILFILLLGALAFGIALVQATNKKERRTYFIVLACSIAVLVGSIIWMYSYYKTWNAYEYKDVTSVVESVETLHEVHIDKVISEKDRENIYYITLSNNKIGTPEQKELVTKKENHPLYRRRGNLYVSPNRGYYKTNNSMLWFDEIKLVLSESEYNSIIGVGNNHLRMNVHILSLDTEEFHGYDHNLVLYRLGCFGEKFTEKEVNELSEQFLAAANARDCKSWLSSSTLADLADFAVID